MAVADMPVPFVEPVAEMLIADTSAELAADMAADIVVEPVVGKSAAVQVADIVAEPVIEVGMPVVASVEQEPELEVDTLAVQVAEQESVPVADIPVPFADPVVESLVVGTSVELLVADLLGQAVAPSF